jgi:putative endonuclease
MYYIYILQSESSGNYYIGHSDDYKRRLIEHNSSLRNTYTSKHRPWKIAAIFCCGTERKTAMEIERFIKQQKKKEFIEKLCDQSTLLTGKLAQLVRVPQVRD